MATGGVTPLQPLHLKGNVMMKSHELYYRILKLATTNEQVCNLRAQQSNQPKTMNDIVKEIIAQDPYLVWA